jgi:hypothetical protein
MKRINMISTYHKVEMRFKVNKTTKRENLRAVCDYDLNLGVVYLTDQLLQPYLLE